MDMQNTQTQDPASAGFFSPESGQVDLVAQPEIHGQTQFTVNSHQIEAAVKEKMDDRQEPDLDRVLEQGTELLFGEETHYKLMDQLADSKNIAADLGNGGFNFMALLIHQSGGTIPGDVILPAGTILMARASEFLNESGVAKVTDEDFEEASHIFGTKIMHTYDPEYKERMQQYSGQAAPDQQMQPDQPQGAMPQAGGGLLNMTGKEGA